MAETERGSDAGYHDFKKCLERDVGTLERTAVSHGNRKRDPRTRLQRLIDWHREKVRQPSSDLRAY